MKLWLKNTSGKRDAVLTMAFLGFLVIIFKVVVSGSKFVISGNEISFSAVDPALVAAVLTPTLGCYVARRYTDKKHKDDKVVATEE